MPFNYVFADGKTQSHITFFALVKPFKNIGKFIGIYSGAVIPDDNFNFGAVNNFWNNAYGIVGISDAVANDICKSTKKLFLVGTIASESPRG